MDPNFDLEIREKLAKKDKQIFHLVVEHFQGWLYSTMHRLVGEHHKALDLTQEVFFHIYMNLSKYDPQRPFAPWFRTVALHSSLNFLRKKKWAEVSLPLEEASFPAVEENYFYHGEGEEQKKILEEALVQLPPKYRIPLLLMYQEDRTVPEIARWMELSENTVKTWLRRGRMELKKILTQAKKE